MLDEVVDISRLANIYFVRQKETKGLGHAVNCARSFVGNEPLQFCTVTMLLLERILLADNSFAHMKNSVAAYWV